MTKYIVKSRHSICTAKGIIGPPVDPENPTSKEIVTVKHFKTGQRGLTALLQHKKCPLIALIEKDKPRDNTEENQEEITKKDLQQPEKDNKSKGAVKK